MEPEAVHDMPNCFWPYRSAIWLLKHEPGEPMSVTSIPWCDYTLNEWEGCTKVSEGCAECYAEKRDRRHMHEKRSHWGKGAPRWRTSESTRHAPYRWNKNPFLCNVCGKPFKALNRSGTHYQNCWHNDQASYHRARVFLGSLMDIFDEEVPAMWLAGALWTVKDCHELDFLLVTKRPQNFLERVHAARDEVWKVADYGPPMADWLDQWLHGNYPVNVWMIASTENQKRLDERIDYLLRIPAAVHGLSCEPLLGELDLKLPGSRIYYPERKGIDWVIAGGESGPNARQMDVAWMHEIQRQCKAAGVAYFAKQLGSRVWTENANAHEWPDATAFKVPVEMMGAAAAFVGLKSRKGEDMAEWPEEMRVRQWPKSSPRSITSGTGAAVSPIARASNAPSSTAAQ